MGITVLKNKVPWGPFTHAQIKDGLTRGDFTLQCLAHAPGLKEWLPLGEVLVHVEHGATLPPVPMESDLPPVPKGNGPATPQPAAVPVRPPELPKLEKPEVKLAKASFILRLMAFVIDCAILFVPVALLFALKAMEIEVQGSWEHIDHESRMQEWALLDRNFHQLALMIAVGVGWLYAAGLECSRWQATVGKRCLGMKVTDMQGKRIDFLRATGRHAAKYLSALFFFLGFIMAIFGSRGMALHDRLASTRVVRR